MKSSDPPELTIGELAGRFGLATHVLRHWETMGLLDPSRGADGHRRYGPEHERRIVFILRGKQAGMSLEQIRGIGAARDGAARRGMVIEQHEELAAQVGRLRGAMEMLEHLLACPEEDFFRCPEFQSMLAPAGQTGTGTRTGSIPSGAGPG